MCAMERKTRGGEGKEEEREGEEREKRKNGKRSVVMSISCKGVTCAGLGTTLVLTSYLAESV